MFLARRPTRSVIDRFIRESQDLPLSYGPVGLVRSGTPDRTLDEVTVAVGRGPADFERARAALLAWTHFDIGWVQTFPRHAPVAVGTVVGVQIRHLGFWSLNGCRVLYPTGEPASSTFGFAYGTLTNHAECGEEIFEVRLDPRTEQVSYRIRAVSRPRATLAKLGYLYTRRLQAAFRRDSALAVRRAIERR